LDFQAIAEYVPPVPPQEPGEPRPFSAQDSARAKRKMIRKMSQPELDDLVAMMERDPERLPRRNGHLNGHAKSA
jgi:hypothetical protein